MSAGLKQGHDHQFYMLDPSDKECKRQIKVDPPVELRTSRLFNPFMGHERIELQRKVGDLWQII